METWVRPCFIADRTLPLFCTMFATHKGPCHTLCLSPCYSYGNATTSYKASKDSMRTSFHKPLRGLPRPREKQPVRIHISSRILLSTAGHLQLLICEFDRIGGTPARPRCPLCGAQCMHDVIEMRSLITLFARMSWAPLIKLQALFDVLTRSASFCSSGADAMVQALA